MFELVIRSKDWHILRVHKVEYSYQIPEELQPLFTVLKDNHHVEQVEIRFEDVIASLERYDGKHTCEYIQDDIHAVIVYNIGENTDDSENTEHAMPRYRPLSDFMETDSTTKA